MKLAGLTGWRAQRAASTPKWHATFASQGSLSVHRWQQDGQAPLYLVSNGAWMPGDDFVTRSIEGGFDDAPSIPKVIPPRFQFAYRSEEPVRRDGLPWTEGYWTLLDPHNPGDVSGAFVELDPIDNCLASTVDTWIDRSPIAAYHRGSGLPLTRRELGSWFEYRLDRGADPIQRLPHFTRPQNPPDLEAGECPDKYHLERTYMRALGLYRQTGCPIARWHICMLTADALLAFTKAGKAQDAGSSWVPFALTTMLAAAHANPHKGGDIVRGIAWVLRLLVAALEVGAPNADEIRSAIASIVTYCELVQLENGAFYNAPWATKAGVPTWADNGEAWTLYGLDKRKSECPSWQVPFLVVALWEAQKLMPQLRRRVTAILAKAKRMWDTCPKVPDMYGGEPGIPLYVVTAINNRVVRRITEGVGEARSMYDARAFQCFREAGLMAVAA